MSVSVLTRRIALTLLGMLAAGCNVTSPSKTEPAPAAAPAAAPGIVISGLVIENRSPDVLTEVRLLVVQTGESVVCGYIPPGRSCSTRFPLRRYQGNSIQVLWDRAGNPRGTPPFFVPVPDPVPSGVPLEVVIGIGGPQGLSAGMRRT